MEGVVKDSDYSKETITLLKKARAIELTKSNPNKTFNLNSLYSAFADDQKYKPSFKNFFCDEIWVLMNSPIIITEELHETLKISNWMKNKVIEPAAIFAHNYHNPESIQIEIPHILCQLALMPPNNTKCQKDKTDFPLLKTLNSFYTHSRTIKQNNQNSNQPPRKSHVFTDLIIQSKNIRYELNRDIVGQEMAIQTIVSGLSNAMNKNFTDHENSQPAATFVLIGPPGVGKTYTAERVAKAMNRKCKRFDMTEFHYDEAYLELIGWSKTYKSPKAGRLTNYAKDHPDAVLIFDEIEKANLSTIQLFYQILDNGKLFDRYYETDISFKDNIIFFTTNAGKSLYENPKHVIFTLKPEAQRSILLSSLENETNPITKTNTFPTALCSRLDLGYLVLFSHLSVPHRITIAKKELDKNIDIYKKEYGIKISYNPLIPIILVYHCGASSDARKIKSLADKIIWTEISNYTQICRDDMITQFFNEITWIEIIPETDKNNTKIDPELPDDIKSLFNPPKDPTILVIMDNEIIQIFQNQDLNISPGQRKSTIKWLYASKIDTIIEFLNTENISFIVFDVWIKGDHKTKYNKTPIKTFEELTQDHIPYALNELKNGQTILKDIYERFSNIPVYLISFDYREIGKDNKHPPIDDELIFDYIRFFHVKGRIDGEPTIIATPDMKNPENSSFFKTIISQIRQINADVFYEKSAKQLAKERKVLTFDTMHINHLNNKNPVALFNIKLRNFELTRCLDACDYCDVIPDIELPKETFDDILGVENAKESLKEIVSWMENTNMDGYYRIRPPKGILLTGPPGTGKTMLARALAGETHATFIERSGTSFITECAGSGPKNIRELFARAKKNAPTIIFIDEIDTFAGKRRGGPEGNRPEEETLNALLTEMDGFRTSQTDQVIVIAATNLPDLLDHAIIRRFDRIIEVERPDKDTRYKYLKQEILKLKPNNISEFEIILKTIASQTTGWTLSDLEKILRQSIIQASKQKKRINAIILEIAFTDIRDGVISENYDPERVAYHEAGHAIVSWYLGMTPIEVSIIKSRNRIGFIDIETNELKDIYTKEELLNRISISMAGRLIEIIQYGPEKVSTGAADDLRKAVDIATDMICLYGMGKDGINSIPIQRFKDEGWIIDKKTKQEINQILSRGAGIAEKIILSHRKIVDEIVRELKVKNRMNKNALETFFKNRKKMKI